MRVRPAYSTCARLYTDATGRTLTVTRVDLEDRQGRHVQGRVVGAGANHRQRALAVIAGAINDHVHDYACSLDTWQAVWRDRQAPTPVSEQSLA